MTGIAQLHPLIIHLPIGIVLFAALMYLLGRFRHTDKYDQAITLAMGVSGIFAVIGVITGLMLSREEGYDANLVSWHQWLGIATTLVILLLYFLVGRGTKGLITGILFALCVVLISLTGHFGGSLTHGLGYLFPGKTSENDTYVDRNRIPVYEGVVKNLLDKRCNSCHNTAKKKGKLDMTTVEAIRKGGKSGEVVQTGTPLESEFLKRLHLPLEEKKHMPPKSKPQLLEDEIRLLTWWIENGLCADCVTGDLDDTLEGVIDRFGPRPAVPENIDLSHVSERQVRTLEVNGWAVTSMSASDPFISLSATNQERISSKAVSVIKKVNENIREIDLSGTVLHERLIEAIVKCSNLQWLNLSRTNVSDADIARLASLPILKVLNIYATEVSDNALEDILRMPALERLYCWQSQITKEGLAKLQTEAPLVDITSGVEEDMFERSRLHPPVILTDSDWFHDSIRVTIPANRGKGVIYYTLDGSVPDSTSTVYDGPLALYRTSNVKAIRWQEGWEQSEVINHELVKVDKTIAKATLGTPPADSYSGQGSKTLVDLQKGSEDFRDGKWLGYQGEHVKIRLELDLEDIVSGVFVSALSVPDSWIFYPQSIKVETSVDGRSFTAANDLDISRDHRVGSELSIFEVSFDQRPAKYVQVEIRSILRNPDWHPTPGGDAWVFIDEVLIN